MAGRYDKSTETTNLLPRACLWLWSSTSGQGLIVARIRHVQDFFEESNDAINLLHTSRPPLFGVICR